jgi:hypothetical protein
VKRAVTAVFILIAISCNVKDRAAGSGETWQVTKLDLATHDKETESVFKNAFLSFYEEGALSFVNVNDKKNTVFRIGHWSEKDDRMHISVKQTAIDLELQVLEASKEWLVLKIMSGPGEQVGTILKCQPSDLYQSASFDLFDPANNSWRVRPAKSEDKDQLRKRVVNHVSFLIGYFDMVEEKELGYFQPWMLKTPLQFYSNGIGFNAGFESENIWTSNFYDEKDAVAGAEIFVESLHSVRVYPADKTSYTKSYRNALVRMRDYIEK